MQTFDAQEFRGRKQKFIGDRDGSELSVADRQSYSETLVKQAIEFLKIGHEKIQSAELAKCASEAEFQLYREEITGQIDIKLRKVEAQIKRFASEVAAAQQRAIEAERRADIAEAALRRLDDGIRTERTRTGFRLERAAA